MGRRSARLEFRVASVLGAPGSCLLHRQQVAGPFNLQRMPSHLLWLSVKPELGEKDFCGFAGVFLPQ